MHVPSDKFMLAKIVNRRQVADDLYVMNVQPDAPFSYKAGQYATLGLVIEGGQIERPYSICSSPYEQQVEFFIEVVPQGELTPLLNKLSVGDEMLMRKIAKGRFTLDLRSGRKNHLLLATVTGVAPYVSYVRTLYQDWKKGESMPGDHKLFCVQGASRAHEFAYREELEKFAAEVPWFHYAATVSRPWEDPEWTGETGRVDDLMRKYVELWGLKPADTTVYLCGHPNMVENGHGIMQRAGWKKDAMQEEVYFVPKEE